MSTRSHTDKQCYKPNEDIIKDAESMESSNSNAAIIKSASTPASLQTIVRFSNGSNMSHTVCYSPIVLYILSIKKTYNVLFQFHRFYLGKTLILM